MALPKAFNAYGGLQMLRKRKKWLICIVIIMIISVLWLYWGNHSVEVEKIRIDDRFIPEQFNGFVIAHVSDLHNARFGGRTTNPALEQGENTIRLLGLADPDFTLSNDLFDETAAMVDKKLQDMSDENPCYRILLSHRPELIDVYSKHPINLVLSGHAHGGQFRLPFIGGIVAPNQGFFPEYTEGKYVVGQTQMIVSRGLGNSIIPIRINNRPELVVVELNHLD